MQHNVCLGDSLVLMDDLEFKSDPYQRVYQYIRRHTAGQNLDLFCFSGAIEGTMPDCLQLLLQYVRKVSICVYMAMLNISHSVSVV